MSGLAAGPSRRPPLSAIVAIAASLVVAVVVSACGGSSTPKATTTAAAGIKGPSEVALQPVSKSTPNPFTEPVGKDKSGVKPPKRAVSTGGGAATYSGNLPGLYGGTRNYATCNASQLVTFLQQNPDKARAWATTLGVQVTQIQDYVSGLTPVILRTDTRVTNHGYVNGQADAIQAVLQAGTAVFVNNYGQPVVKCFCGNPLTAPIAATTPVYVGPPWTGFATTHITIIETSVTIIKRFTLYDPNTGMTFTRPAGTSGTDDSPYRGTQTETTSSTTAPAPAPLPTQAPTSTTQQTTQQTTPAPAEQPSASFSPNPGQQGDTFVLTATGFRPGASLAVTLTRPDGVVEHYTIDVGANGVGSFTFGNTAGVVTGTYNAVVTNPDTGASTGAAVTVNPS